MLKSFRTLGNSNIRIEIVHCTSPSLSQLLFNNGKVRRNSQVAMDVLHVDITW